MIAAFGGADVRCAPYATFGSAELSRHAVNALKDRHACLLANHGAIAVGHSLDKAIWRATELETIARQYWHSLQCGGSVLLTANEIQEAMAGFASYGR
jgi:L-fuculose-phosphate aldolase